MTLLVVVVLAFELMIQRLIAREWATLSRYLTNHKTGRRAQNLGRNLRYLPSNPEARSVGALHTLKLLTLATLLGDASFAGAIFRLVEDLHPHRCWFVPSINFHRCDVCHGMTHIDAMYETQSGGTAPPAMSKTSNVSTSQFFIILQSSALR